MWWVVRGFFSTVHQSQSLPPSCCCRTFFAQLQQEIKFPSLTSHFAAHRKFTDLTLTWLREYQQGKLDPRAVLEALLGVCLLFFALFWFYMLDASA